MHEHDLGINEVFDSKDIFKFSNTHTRFCFSGDFYYSVNPTCEMSSLRMKVLQASLIPGGGSLNCDHHPCLSFAGSWAARNGHSEARPRWWKVHTAGAMCHSRLSLQARHSRQRGPLPRLLNVVPLLRYGLALLWFETVSIRCPSPWVGYISSLSLWFQNGKMKLTGPLSNRCWELK